MTRPLVSFVIPVRNDAIRLARCLQSIVANDYPPDRLQIVVADNGSSDDSAAVARSYGADVLTLPSARLGELRNRAAGEAAGDVLAFVDADHEIAGDWIQAAVEALADPGVGAAGAACLPPQPGTWVQRLYDRLRRHPPRRQVVDWLGSGNMAVKRAVFDAVGGFDVSLETCEDVDLCRKIRAHAVAIVADPLMRNTHFGDPATLRHVFVGEMWRGRDNVRVSLRPPRSARSLVSAAIPIAMWVALLAAVAGLIIGSTAGFAVTAGALAVVVALISVRAARMFSGGSMADLPGSLAVAAAYELGRAFALSGLATYRRRRKAASA